MNPRRLFTSRYTLLLESELGELRERHRAEIERINNSHKEELNRCILEANRGWAEADRLRQFLVPGLAQSTRVEPETPSKEKEHVEEERGTPFQMMAARVWKQQKAAAEEAERQKKLAHQFPTPQKQETPPAVPKEN